MQIIKGIVIIVGILICAMISMVITLNRTLNSSKGNNQKVIKGNRVNGKKVLIIFQPSISDTTAKVVSSLAKGFSEFGYTVVTNNPGEHLSTDLAQYDLVMFGSPVYSAQVSQALLKYMEKIKVSAASKIIIFSTGSNPEKPEFKMMEDAMGRHKIYKKMKFKPSEEGCQEAYKFAKVISKEIG